MAMFYTIGHSNRSIEAFIALLREAGIEVVADVRTVRKSRHNPQFNADALAASLKTAGIDYRPIPALGGLRGKLKGAGPSPNSFWENEAFRNFADYAGTPGFGEGLAGLRNLGHARPCAAMCAEALWWRCHRRIIADYLIAAGEAVMHILGEGHREPARMTESAVVHPDGIITYPAGCRKTSKSGPARN